MGPLSLTESGWALLHAAREEAVRLGAPAVGTEHLLLALSRLDDDPVRRAFAALELPPGEPGRAVDAVAAKAEGQAPRPLPLSANVTAVLEGAGRAATLLGADGIDPEHVLLSLLAAGGRAGSALEKAGRTLPEARARCLDALRIPPEARASFGPVPAVTEAAGAFEVEDLYGRLPARELTRKPAEGLVPGVRERELDRLAELLDRDDRPSLFLVGPEGCGRRSLIRAYAERARALAYPGIARRQVHLFDPGLARKSAPPVFEGEGEVVARWFTELLAHAGAGIFVFPKFLADEWVYDDFIEFVVPAVERRWATCVFLGTMEDRLAMERGHPGLRRATLAMELGRMPRPEVRRILAARVRAWPEEERVSMAETAMDAAVGLAERFLRAPALPGSAVEVVERTRRRLRELVRGPVVIGTGEVVRTVAELSGKTEAEVGSGEVWARGS
jgi:ATP-dependent Clp protease ATP-binding subunit ClpC